MSSPDGRCVTEVSRSLARATRARECDHRAPRVVIAALAQAEKHAVLTRPPQPELRRATLRDVAGLEILHALALRLLQLARESHAARMSSVGIYLPETPLIWRGR